MNHCRWWIQVTTRRQGGLRKCQLYMGFLRQAIVNNGQSVFSETLACVCRLCEPRVAWCQRQQITRSFARCSSDKVSTRECVLYRGGAFNKRRFRSHRNYIPQRNAKKEQVSMGSAGECMTTSRIPIQGAKAHLSGLTPPAKLLAWRCRNPVDLIIHVRNFAAPSPRQSMLPSNTPNALFADLTFSCFVEI